MAEDSYIDVARQRRTVNKLKALIDKKADASAVGKEDPIFISIKQTINSSGKVTYPSTITAYRKSLPVTADVVFKAITEGTAEIYIDIQGVNTFPAISKASTNSNSLGNTVYIQGILGLEPYPYTSGQGFSLEIFRIIVPNDPKSSSLSFSTTSNRNIFFDKETMSVVTNVSSLGSSLRIDNITIGIKDSAVTTAKLADGSVTKAKLGSDVVIPEAVTDDHINSLIDTKLSGKTPPTIITTTQTTTSSNDYPITAAQKQEILANWPNVILHCKSGDTWGYDYVLVPSNSGMNIFHFSSYAETAGVKTSIDCNDNTTDSGCSLSSYNYIDESKLKTILASAYVADDGTVHFTIE